MTQIDNKTPIFVVGAPRSGTTLLAALLGAHSRLSCGPETRFFHFLAMIEPSNLLESWPDNAVDFLFSVLLIDPVPDHYELSREDIQIYLSKKQPGIPAILMSLTEQFMWHESKRRWIEKSPEHLMVVNDVRKYFPESQIIRIIRDPRDVALSMIQTPWAPQDYFDALMFWRKYDDRSRSFFQVDKNTFSLRYEDLILDPETVMKQVCEFIGEEFEPQMLDTTVAARNVVTIGEPWKNRVYRPIDKSRLQVWKRELDAEKNSISESLVGDRLDAYGYECIKSWKKIALVHPSLETMLRYRHSLGEISGANIQLRTKTGNSDLIIFAGNPDYDGWLSYEIPERWQNAFHILLEIIRKKLAHQRVVWVADEKDRIAKGWSSRMLTSVLRIVGYETMTEGNPQD